MSRGYGWADSIDGATPPGVVSIWLYRFKGCYQVPYHELTMETYLEPRAVRPRMGLAVDLVSAEADLYGVPKCAIHHP